MLKVGILIAVVLFMASRWRQARDRRAQRYVNYDLRRARRERNTAAVAAYFSRRHHR